MPTSAVIPALREYLKVVVVKQLVVDKIAQEGSSIVILFSKSRM